MVAVTRMRRLARPGVTSSSRMPAVWQARSRAYMACARDRLNATWSVSVLIGGQRTRSALSRQAATRCVDWALGRGAR
ncbi:MAG: hypothetical protein AUG44_07425 [Actinobacteria bacterium 13_1_20CM_3_71_11]|nr:MAG: hypothetical protein AUG44_07425 [Actinobacteria bacterium 13_1_20CM_3_71_11]